MAFVIALLNALAALPAIAKYVEQFCMTVMGWWVARQNAETAGAIANAAAMQAHAQTEGDRYAADQAWHDLFASKSRIS